jgi:hypothetical protein
VSQQKNGKLQIEIYILIYSPCPKINDKSNISFVNISMYIIHAAFYHLNCMCIILILIGGGIINMCMWRFGWIAYSAWNESHACPKAGLICDMMLFYMKILRMSTH